MTNAAPRLLVGLKPSDSTRAAIDRALPGVPWAFAEATPPPPTSEVEALLVGALDRGPLASFDPRSAPRLAFVQRIYTGLDGFPFERFPPSVAVAGNVGAFAPYVAEQAVMLALAAARDLNSAREKVAAGVLRPAPEERSLLGATVAILGLGSIGTEIARRVRPFGAHVVGVNRSGAASAEAERTFAADRLREALPGSAVVFEARPLTRRTERSIGAAELAAMPEDGILVNVGRAATVDADALFDHLRGHTRFRAGFDVWWEEDYREGRLPDSARFAALPNFYGTPHCASVIPGAEARALTAALENLDRFFRDGRPRFVVDRSEYVD